MWKASATFLVLIAAVMVEAQTTPAPPAPPSAPQAAPAPAPHVHPRRSMRARLADEDSTSHRRAYLGVDINSVSSSRAAELKLKEARGVEIVMVDGDSPAGKSGLREHDVVQSFDGKAVNDPDDLQRYIRDATPGKTVAIGIVRNGQPMSVNATLSSHEEMAMGDDMRIVIPRIAVTIPRIPEIPSFVMMQSWRRSGIQVENLNTQLGEFFGVKSGDGVLVRSVDKGSRAEKAGLKAGDVIVRVGNERISGSDDFMRTMRQARSGTVQLGIVRDRREQTLSINLPPSGPGDGSEMHEMEIEVPSAEISASMQDWTREFRKEMEKNSKEWRKQWREQEKQWRDAYRDAYKDLYKDWDDHNR